LASINPRRWQSSEKRVFLKELPHYISIDTVRSIFSQFGQIKSLSNRGVPVRIDFYQIQAAEAAKQTPLFIGTTQLKVIAPQPKIFYLENANLFPEETLLVALRKNFGSFTHFFEDMEDGSRKLIVNFRSPKEDSVSFELEGNTIEMQIGRRTELRAMQIQKFQQRINEFYLERRIRVYLGATIRIRHLPKEISEEQLRELCSPYGQILQIKILGPTNTAYIHFQEPSSGIQLFQNFSAEVSGKLLNVGFQFPAVFRLWNLAKDRELFGEKYPSRAPTEQNEGRQQLEQEFEQGTEYQGTEYQGTEYQGTEYQETEYQETENEDSPRS
jgi:RNA recognition motif-containing protein